VSRYAIARAARSDLLDIIDYITADSPSAAYRVRDAIYEAFGLIAERPEIGHVRTDLTDLPVRFWPVMGRYSIVYRAAASTIEIVRVFGPGRDIATALT
jgi:plasmid stabilization system protein ParE